METSKFNVLYIALTTALVFSTLYTHHLNRKKNLDEMQVLLQVYEMKTPDSFRIIYEKTKGKPPKNTEEAINRLEERRKKGHFKGLIKDELTTYQLEDLKDNFDSIYFQPLTILNRDIAEKSLIMNLLNTNEPESGICVCKDLTSIGIENFGAPLVSFEVEDYKITYIDKNKKSKLLKNKNKSVVPLYIDKGKKGTLNISEVTLDLENALCNVAMLDPNLSATDVRYNNKFFFYEKLEMNFIAESIFRVKTPLIYVMEKKGNRLVATIKKQNIFSKLNKKVRLDFYDWSIWFKWNS